MYDQTKDVMVLDREAADHRAKVQTEQSAEVQAGHTRVQIKEKPKRRVTRLNYLRDYA